MTRTFYDPGKLIGSFIPSAKVATPNIPSAADAAADEEKATEEARRKVAAEQAAKSGRAKTLLTPASAGSTLGSTRRTLLGGV